VTGGRASATVLFWDVDGTLLTTRRAGITAWERAAEGLVGTTVDLSDLLTAGLTDARIAAEILAKLGLDTAPQSAWPLVRAYEDHLPSCLPLRQGHVLPGVQGVLDALRVEPRVASFLLTGNTRRGALAKLRHYGLADYFQGGAFADDAAERPGIARVGLEQARQALGSECVAAVYVIGDTPLDIECGKAIGARTLAVATGEYSSADLAAHHPWRVLDHLPGPSAFLELIELPGRRCEA
jgi:phosphoglycolate phosphatase